ncbi:MAG: hypothetical protein E4H07_09600 [Nitrosomonadales bacterium]|nr:MAG: hypothetical protein E4H07_09600 [Nitrosomonadales bacterium]
MVPYRYPTRTEVLSNQSIHISSQPITESAIFIEKGVLEYLVANDFMKVRQLNKWKKLSKLTSLTPKQAIAMMRHKKREAQSLRRFQGSMGLPQTGVIDTPVIRIVFPTTCGTPDYIDEPFDDGFGGDDDIESTNSSTPVDLKKK